MTKGIVTQNSVILHWDSSTDDGSGVAGYKIKKEDGQQSTVIDVGNILTRQITGLTANTRYHFSVMAYDHAGNESAFSRSEIAVTTSQLDGIPTPPRIVKGEATSSLHCLGVGRSARR